MLMERVVVAVSPDGSQLAIARSNYDARARNGRVELWDLKTGEFRQMITGFDGSVSYVSFAPDGQSLVTTSTEIRQSKIQSNPRDRQVDSVTELKWWDVRTGEFIRKTTLEGRSGQRGGPPLGPDLLGSFLRSMLKGMALPVAPKTALSPDGTAIAAVSHYAEPGAGVGTLVESFEIDLFDIMSGKRKLKMSGRAASMSSPGRAGSQIAFSPDGRLFAVTASREVRVWDATTGKKFQTINKFDGHPSAITFSPDSQSIAISSGEFSKIDWTIQESQISVWEVSNAKMTRSRKVKSNLVASLMFAPNSNALLMGTLQYERDRTVGTVKVWDFMRNRLWTLNIHEGQIVSSLHLLPEQLLLQSGEDVEVRDLRTWRVTQAFETNHEDGASRRTKRFVLSVKQVEAVRFSSDGITVSGSIPEEGLRVWDSRTGAVKQPQIKTTDGLIARSANGGVLGEVRAQEIKIWDLTTGTSRNLPRTTSTTASAVALSSDGRLLAIAEGSQIQLRDLADEKFSRSFGGNESGVQKLAFSIDGRVLVSADESGTVKTWDVGSGQTKTSISTDGIVTALAITPTGQFVASAGSDYTISVWNAQTGALQLKLRKHDNVVNALEFSPDGETLASGGDDRVAVLWDIISGKSKQTLKGHDITVTSLAFSPNGQLLATGSGNASVVLWNVNNGKLERILR